MTAALAIPTARDFGFPTVQEYKPLARFIDHDALADLLMGVRGEDCHRRDPHRAAPAGEAPRHGRAQPVQGERGQGEQRQRHDQLAVRQASVIRQRAREGLTPDFEALPRKWGVRLPGTPLIAHDGMLYLEVKVERALDQRYETVDGKSLDGIAVGTFLPSRGPSRQGVSREVILRDYGLASIVSIRLGGVVYLVRDNPATVEKETPARRSA